jgi:Holliday junction resolvase
MSEQKVQKKILDWLTKNGFYSIKTIVSNKKGVPDIIACTPNGEFLAIEVKFGANKASKLQEYNIQQIKNRKGYALVCWDLEQLITYLRKEKVI